MSRAGVGTVIEKLLTDERLRFRFALDRMETIENSACAVSSSHATRSTFLAGTDARLWFLGDQVRGEWQR
jgi:hypothetical protein